MIKRRRFLQTMAAAAGYLSCVGPREVAAALLNGSPDAIQITEPFSGAVVNRRHGELVDGGLKIRVAGSAPKDDRVTVNGQPAAREGDRFVANVVLRDKVTDITAIAQGAGGQSEAHAKVRWDRQSMPRYRFSIDDNSFFLRDIAQHDYRSLLDCWYLKMLKDLHTQYGVKFTVNIYYTTGDDFSLPQLSDRYRGEWRDMSDWLKLAFHAHANLPDRPYQDAPPEKLLADLDQVAEQIHRFAGPEAYAPPTVIHWGMTRQSALQPLTSRGVRALSGYFGKSNDVYDVNYRFNDEISEYLSRHDAWMDFSSGIIFSRVDIICNNVPIDRIVSTLEPQIQDPNTAEIFDLFTHEQYFWSFYSNYIPDHPKRLDVVLRWVTEHGYQPVFFHEGFLVHPTEECEQHSGSGFQGNDEIYGGDGQDSLFGEAGQDVLDGGAGADLMFGGLGTDLLRGGSGSDWLFGGAGHDKLFGEAGNDWLFGESGNDELDGGDGYDWLFGGPGWDVLRNGERVF